MANTDIEVLKNGPLYVTGEFTITDNNGNPIQMPKPGVAVLCRCGASENKPFCDGTHSDIGFKAAAEAVPGSKEE